MVLIVCDGQETVVSLSDISLPEVIPYLVAVLGLLVVWEVHQIAVRAGRIKAVNFWNRSGIRMFLLLTPTDQSTCAVCRDVAGSAFSPTYLAGKGFKHPRHDCKDPVGCRCQLIGFYGAWPVAATVRLRLRQKNGVHRLSDEQVDRFIASAKDGTKGATMIDHISICLVEALRSEQDNPELAIERYLYVLTQAADARDQEFVIPSYLRLTELLERQGRRADALKLIDRFFKVYGDAKKAKKGRPWPSDSQLETMSLRKTRLMSVVAPS